ncbi:LysE family transporter [Streptomyces avidinii]|uniref:Arginine exporter protein ArgO n=1 Tax=Streptomyces avidinii TaxID=1895 RepID=A0ABS4L1M1_STRAV|nr:LysE family transporter [Streptomyces avidinii]MBP2036182.1 arginine exporter protein ArgO [Streptomyces avidinii]
MSELMTPALAGAAAGLGVAMPMGAMSVLLLQEAMRERRTAVAAAAGIAAVDLGYAALATAVGPWAASHISPVEAWVRLASAVILLAIAAHGLRGATSSTRAAAGSPGTSAGPGTSGPVAVPGTSTVPGTSGSAAGPGTSGSAAASGASTGPAASGTLGSAAASGTLGSAAVPGSPADLAPSGLPGRDRAPAAAPASPASPAASGTPTTSATPGAPGTPDGSGSPASSAAPAAPAGPAGPARPGRVFARYVGLTALNPTTALYFAALTTAQGATLRTGPAGAAFLLGVGAASLLWQQSLVALGALAGARVPDRARIWTFRLGYGLVAAYALKIAFPLPTLG